MNMTFSKINDLMLIQTAVFCGLCNSSIKLFIYLCYFQNSSGMQSVYNQDFKIHYIVSRKLLKGLSLVLAGS